MNLYHASLNTYENGRVIIAKNQTSFYPRAVSAIEREKPNGSPSRAICVFATDDLDLSFFYAIGQKWDISSTKIYRVNMQSYQRSPMVIVHKIQRALESGNDISVLVDEYWNPSRERWNFYECFAPEMTIIEQINQPTIDEALMREKYSHDSNKVKKLLTDQLNNDSPVQNRFLFPGCS